MSFESEVAAFARLAAQRIDAVGRAAAQETGRRLIERSPVGTGHFRANWQFGDGAEPAGELPTAGVPGNPAPAPEIPAIAPSEEGRTLYWTNHAADAEALEEGRNGHPPLGLTALAEAEFPAVVAEAAGKFAD